MGEAHAPEQAPHPGGVGVGDVDVFIDEVVDPVQGSGLVGPHPCPVGPESSRAARVRSCSWARKGSAPRRVLALPSGVPFVDGLSVHAEQAGARGLGLGQLALAEQFRGEYVRWVHPRTGCG